MPCDPHQQVLAQKILHHSRRRLTQLVPLLLTAVYALEDRERDIPGSLSTDGTYLWYAPETVIDDFRRDHDAVARQLLHITLHCLLGHLPLRLAAPSETIFDGAADWKVYTFTAALGIWETLYGNPSTRRSKRLKADIREPALPAMCHTMEENAAYRQNLLDRVHRNRLHLDDHRLWHPETPTGMGCGSRSPLGTAIDDGRPAPDWSSIRTDLFLAAEHSTQWGHLCGTLTDNFDPAEENTISYAHFLRRLAFPEERLLTDPDSFDPRWYHLGLIHYGNIPLLEPSELSEPPAPNDIVIALDTSGSCSGEICRRFLRETLNLLRDISARASSFRILLLQCDTDIQQEMELHSADDLDLLAEQFSPQGFGGTDFRPVFDRISEKIVGGELPRVCALLYLSDSYGNFPDTPPDYPTVFILPPDQNNSSHNCPPWVTVIRLHDDISTITIEENLS